TAHDQTPNHRDATLEGPDGDLPIWISDPENGVAIDLAHGATHNAIPSRPGPNNRQVSPIFVKKSNGELKGWLGGSMPHTPYHSEYFSSEDYAQSGAVNAETYLVFIDMMTDEHGFALFDAPYTGTVDKPIITATATDPEGNTSEVSSRRVPALIVPESTARMVAGTPFVFTAAAGTGIALRDPDARPFDPLWDLTMSV